LRAGLVSLGLLVLVACGGGGSGTTPPPAAPAISTFAASPSTVTTGNPTSLTAEFTDGTGVIMPGSITATSGSSVPITPSVTTSYTLTVTNSAGLAVHQSVTITVVAPPTTPVITAPALVTAGATGLTGSVPTQDGSTYAWTIAGGTITAGGSAAQVTYTAGASGSVQLDCVVTNAAGTASTQGTVTETIVAAPVTPVVTVPATITAGASGLIASVPVQAGAAYAWSITGGAITAGAGTNQITFTAGTSGSVQVGCTVTNQAGTAATQGTAASAIVAAPSITSFTVGNAGVTAGNASITAGTATTISAVFAGGTGTINQGIGSVSSGVAVATGSLAGNTTYTLTVTNGAGTSVTAQETVEVQAAPAITSFTAALPAVTAGSATTLTAVFTGGTGTINQGIGPVSTGVAAATGSLAGNTTYTLTVTNGAGTSVTAQATVTVATAPAIASFTAAQSPVTSGTATTLTADFSGGTGTIDQGIGPVSTGVAVSTGSLGASTSYTLTVTNSLGASVTAPVTVTVVAPPVVTAFTASQPSIGAGGSLTLNASFTGGTGSISPGAIAVTSPAAPTVTPSVSTNYVLTVTNAAGTSVTATTRVVAGSLADFAGQASGLGNVTGSGGGARFYGPVSSVYDAAGNIYVADQYNNVIRMVDPTGAVTILAGTLDVAGSADGPGLAASFNTPTGLAVDPSSGSPAGRIYVADSLNNKIRLLTISSGTVTVSTFAGDGTTGTTNGSSGSPTTAEFDGPAGLTVDASGNVWVADTGADTIREITTAGVVSTIGVALTAGHADSTPGPATFNQPRGIAVDGSGNAYVADTGNHTIRLIQFPGGVATVSTYAGVWTGGPGNSNSLAGTPLGGFNTPMGVALDPSGNVYVADTGNQVIRTITPLGVGSGGFTPSVSTLVGHNTDSNYLDGLGGVETESSTTAAGGAYFDFPTSVSLNSAGTSLVVSDFNNNAIRLVPVSAGSVPASSLDLMTSTLAGTANWDGPYYFDSSAGSPRFNSPFGVAVDAVGNIYVGDSGNNAIRLITPAGTVSTFAGTPPASSLAGTPPASGFTDGAATTLATFSSPSAVAVDTTTGATAGNIYVADTNNNAVRKIAGGTVSTIATGLNTPLGIAVDSTTLASAGTIYVADTFNEVIRAIPAGGGTMTILAGTLGTAGGPTSASFYLPYGVAVDNSALASAGTVYVADTYNNAIRMIAAGGAITTLAGSGSPGFADGTGSAALFNHPGALAVDPGTGYVYVADTNNQVVRLIVPATGAVTTLVGVGLTTAEAGTGILPSAFPAALPSSLAFPFGIAVDPALILGASNPSGSLVISVADAILTAPF
jgi:sugar lactone lactonase YvrE